MDADTRNLALVVLGVGAFAFWKMREADRLEREGLAAAGGAAPPGGAPAPAAPRRLAGTNTSRLLVMREAFHLRPRATAESIGPELPAGTEVEVGSPTAITRTVNGRTERLFGVHLADGRLGWAFLQADVWPRFLPSSSSSSTKAGALEDFFPARELSGAHCARRY